MFRRKNRSYEHEILEKSDHFESRPSWKSYAKAIAFAKSSVWVNDKNSQKHAKNDSTSSFKIFPRNNRS